MVDERPVVQEIPVDSSKTNEQLETEAKRPPVRTLLSGPYGIKTLKTFPGMEGTAYDFTLTRDGKPVAHVHDDGNGGMPFVSWDDRKGGLSSEDDIFNAFVEKERAKIPADKMFYEKSERDLFDGEVFIGNLFNEAQRDRRWRRAVKTHTLFQVGDDVGRKDQWMSIKGTGPDVRAHIMKKHGSKPVRIINDEYKG
jgi:hypothetical protein